MKETRKLRKNREGQPTQGNQAQDEGGRDSGVGGRKREESEGNARQKRSAVTAGHPKLGGEGKGAAVKHKERRTRGMRKRGGEYGSTRDGDDKKIGKIGKRLGLSLRTHPQPENTTLSVLSMKDLPA